MSTTEIKNKIHQYIDESDEPLLRMIYAMLEAYHAEAATGSGTQEYNQELDDAMNRISDGDFYTQEEVSRILNKKNG